MIPGFFQFPRSKKSEIGIVFIDFYFNKTKINPYFSYFM